MEIENIFKANMVTNKNLNIIKIRKSQKLRKKN